MFRCLVDYEYVDSEYVDYDWKYLVDNPMRIPTLDYGTPQIV